MAYKDYEEQQAYFAARCRARRDLLNELKVNTGCLHCGYDHDPLALEFHHREPRVGRWPTIGSLMAHSINRIQAEIWKCDILCANCHAIETRG